MSAREHALRQSKQFVTATARAAISSWEALVNEMGNFKPERRAHAAWIKSEGEVVSKRPGACGEDVLAVIEAPREREATCEDEALLDLAEALYSNHVATELNGDVHGVCR